MPGYDTELLAQFRIEAPPVAPQAFRVECAGLPLGVQMLLKVFEMAYNDVSNTDYAARQKDWEEIQDWLRRGDASAKFSDPLCAELVADQLESFAWYQNRNNQTSRWLAEDLSAGHAEIAEIIQCCRAEMAEPVTRTAAALTASEQIVQATDVLRYPWDHHRRRALPPTRYPPGLYEYLATRN